MMNVYELLFRAWVVLREVGNANLSWFPPKLGVFVERFVPIDMTKLCPNGVHHIECHRLLNFAIKNIADVIKLVYNRWVVYDYAICLASFAWSLMNNNLNHQSPMLFVTFVAGHVVQTGVHAFVIQTVTRCRDNDTVCGWFEDELTPLHGMITLAFLLVYVICLRSNTTAQRTIARVERLDLNHVRLHDDLLSLQEDLAQAKEDLAQTRETLEQTQADMELIKIRSKVANTTNTTNTRSKPRNLTLFSAEEW